MQDMRIAIDADDVAIGLKNQLLHYLHQAGWQVTDLGLSKKEGAFYPEIAYHLAKKIQSGEFDRGILLCGTGIGMSIMANKVKGVYAGLCHDVYAAERLAKSNDANVLTMGAKVIGIESAKKVVDAWLASRFEGGTSLSKVQQMRALEQECFRQTE